jgi:hypothetical protein
MRIWSVVRECQWATWFDDLGAFMQVVGLPRTAIDWPNSEHLISQLVAGRRLAVVGTTLLDAVVEWRNRATDLPTGRFGLVAQTSTLFGCGMTGKG